MTIPELANVCIDALNHPERSRNGKPLVTLVWTKGKNPFPRKGWPRPKHLLCEHPRRERVYLYDAMDVLAALAAHKLIDVVYEDRENFILTEEGKLA